MRNPHPCPPSHAAPPHLSLRCARSGTNPTYAAFDAATSTAYFTNENLEDGCIKSFRLSSDGKLAALNSQPVEGNHPCYLAVTADSSAVLTASYVSGHVHIFPTGPDGSLEAGSTPHPPSQRPIGRPSALHWTELVRGGHWCGDMARWGWAPCVRGWVPLTRLRGEGAGGRCCR